MSWLMGYKNTLIAVLFVFVIMGFYSEYRYNKGVKEGRSDQVALQQEADAKVQELNQKNLEFIAEQIKNIRVENKTIYNKAVKEVITNEKVYNDPNCNLPASGLRELNKALSPRK